jgi:hypothetical protein
MTSWSKKQVPVFISEWIIVRINCKGICSLILKWITYIYCCFRVAFDSTLIAFIIVSNWPKWASDIVKCKFDCCLNSHNKYTLEDAQQELLIGFDNYERKRLGFIPKIKVIFC